VHLVDFGLRVSRLANDLEERAVVHIVKVCVCQGARPVLESDGDGF